MKLFLSIFIIVFILNSCSTEPWEIPTLEVGQEFTDTNVRVITVDTFMVRMSTMKFDSINTSDSQRLLVGTYVDDFFGRVRSESYFELGANNYTLSSDSELDSVALILGYDHYFYNDTTSVATINVHVISEDVETDENVFFNTSKLNFDSIPLVIRRYRPEPFDEDSLHISLPFEFGQGIFDLIQENDINNDEDLHKKLKGITLQPDVNDNASVIGFTRNAERTYLRFFYSEPNEFEDSEKYFDFFINQNSQLPKAFNRIQSDVIASPLINLTDQEISLPSTVSEDLSFIQAGSGYATRIEFPSIRSIEEIPGNGTVLSAILEIKPLISSFNDTLPIRDSLNVSVVDQNNIITKTVVNGNGAVLGRINQTDIEFNDIFYQIPLGAYIDQELAEVPEIDNALVIYTKNYNETVDRIVLQGEGNSDYKAKLILTYAIYEE